jgi:peptidoglycan biosynthesis protein MviN/MurJ (putative lipid II flippase)
MTEATCAVLTAIFPLVLLTVVLERRAIHVNIRRREWFRKVTQVTIVSALAGLLLTVLGVQWHGLNVTLSFLAWAAFAVAVGGLTFNLLAAGASAEVEEDETD